MSVKALELTIKGEVESLHLEEGDRILVSIDKKLPREQLDALKEQTLELFPGHEVIVLMPGLRIGKASE